MRSTCQKCDFVWKQRLGRHGQSSWDPQPPGAAKGPPSRTDEGQLPPKQAHAVGRKLKMDGGASDA